jgi:hypothetical protein
VYRHVVLEKLIEKKCTVTAQVACCMRQVSSHPLCSVPQDLQSKKATSPLNKLNRSILVAEA